MRSFFMTEQESSKILSHLKSHNSNKNIPNKNFKISGIFYINSDSWTVWINGIAYSTIGQQPDFSIDSVSENYVSLTLNDGTCLNLSVATDEQSDITDDAKSTENNDNTKY
jgi:hypothetical protein